MTHEQFRAYLIDVHGPLVKSITEVAADIRRYTYNFARSDRADVAFGHPTADLDVVTQGIFDSREAQLHNMTHPRFKEFLRPDEANFADTERAVMHYTSQQVVVDGPTTATKIFYFRRRKAGLDRAVFQRQWLSRFPSALRTAPGFDNAVSRYVQNHVYAEADHPDGGSTKFYDVIDELWITDEASLAGLSACAGAVGVVESELLTTHRTCALLTETVVNIG